MHKMLKDTKKIHNEWVLFPKPVITVYIFAYIIPRNAHFTVNILLPLKAFCRCRSKLMFISLKLLQSNRYKTCRTMH